ncbi:MAG: hypothetical protein R3C03_06020 [Pirellulaceae bacterium]
MTVNIKHRGVTPISTGIAAWTVVIIGGYGYLKHRSPLGGVGATIGDRAIEQ